MFLIKILVSLLSSAYKAEAEKYDRHSALATTRAEVAEEDVVTFEEAAAQALSDANHARYEAQAEHADAANLKVRAEGLRAKAGQVESFFLGEDE